MRYFQLLAVQLLAISLSYLIPWTCEAGEISLRYEDFYSRLKVMHQQKYQLVDLSFSVPPAKGCLLQRASIITESQSSPLSYTKNQRLFLPYDEQLKQQRALVNLNINGDAADCGLAVQVRAKSPKQRYEETELNQLKREMNDFLAAMKGFPMKLFHHEIRGLKFQLHDNTKVKVEWQSGVDEYTITGQWSLSAEQMQLVKQLDFSNPPDVISPWVD